MFAKQPYPHRFPEESHTQAMDVPKTSSEQVLQELLAGNQRFMSFTSHYPHQENEWRSSQTKGQRPIACIVGCVDSRVPPELIFDQGIGDLFVIRSAGHALDECVLGSIEFGIEELHIPLLMVLGHESCGAVAAAIESFTQHITHLNHIQKIVETIYPAIGQTNELSGENNQNVVQAHIALTVRRLQENPVIQTAIAQREVTVIGAYYNLHTGLVQVTVP